MSRVTVSTKYQVVIPKDVRKEITIKAGQKFSCIAKSGVIHLIPDQPLASLKGFAKGISAKEFREKKDRV